MNNSYSMWINRVILFRNKLDQITDHYFRQIKPFLITSSCHFKKKLTFTIKNFWIWHQTKTIAR